MELRTGIQAPGVGIKATWSWHPPTLAPVLKRALAWFLWPSPCLALGFLRDSHYSFSLTSPRRTRVWALTFGTPRLDSAARLLVPVYRPGSLLVFSHLYASDTPLC